MLRSAVSDYIVDGRGLRQRVITQPRPDSDSRSFRQLRRFHHVINSDKVFGTHRRLTWITERVLALPAVL
jgi:hypothetical protein